jgi:hypothetical protein
VSEWTSYSGRRIIVMKAFGSASWPPVLAAVVVCCGFAGLGFSGSSQEKNVVTVSVKDMPDAVRIIGICGQPLGSLITIRGKWVAQVREEVRKDAGPFLEVSLVNGKKPEAAVEFSWSQMNVIFFAGHPGRGSKRGESWDWRFDWAGTEAAPTPEVGETWEMLGTETGHFDRCYSKEVQKEIGDVPVQMPEFSGPSYTSFEYIAIKRVK